MVRNQLMPLLFLLVEKQHEVFQDNSQKLVATPLQSSKGELMRQPVGEELPKIKLPLMLLKLKPKPSRLKRKKRRRKNNRTPKKLNATVLLVLVLEGLLADRLTEIVARTVSSLANLVLVDPAAKEESRLLRQILTTVKTQERRRYQAIHPKLVPQRALLEAIPKVQQEARLAATLPTVKTTTTVILTKKSKL